MSSVKLRRASISCERNFERLCSGAVARIPVYLRLLVLCFGFTEQVVLLENSFAQASPDERSR